MISTIKWLFSLKETRIPAAVNAHSAQPSVVRTLANHFLRIPAMSTSTAVGRVLKGHVTEGRLHVSTVQAGSPARLALPGQGHPLSWEILLVPDAPSPVAAIASTTPLCVHISRKRLMTNAPNAAAGGGSCLWAGVGATPMGRKERDCFLSKIRR